MNASSVDTASFTANWKLLTGATSYKLDVATDVAFTSYVTGYQNKSVTGTSQAVNSGLVSSTLYFYRVRATDKGGVARTSNVVTVTTNVNLGPEQLTVAINKLLSPDAKTLIVR